MNLLKHFTYPAAAALLQDSGRICADTICNILELSNHYK